MRNKYEMRNLKFEKLGGLILLVLLMWTGAAGQQVSKMELRKLKTKIYYPEWQTKKYLLPEPMLMGGFYDPIIITAPRIPVTLNTPAPVMKLHPEDLQRDDNLTIAPALNRIPGVYMQSGTLSTNRISIRGIGSRSPFGTAKIRAYLDEIPLTSGVGETSLEDIDLSLLQEVEIFKGPTASVYGAGLGGLIHLKSLAPLNPPQGGTSSGQAFAQTQVGSFGLWRTVAGVNLSGQKARLDLNYNKTHSDGWRDNNEYDREGFTALSKVNVIKNGITTLLANYTRVKGFIPSSLNKNDFENNPRKAATIWANIKGFEEYDKIIAGISHQQSFSNKFNNTTSLFSTWRDAYEPRPFGILDENSVVIGGRTKFEYKQTESLRYNIGGEIFSENYNWQNFQLFRNADGTVSPDILLQDNQENRFYYNVFAEAEWRLRRWTLSAGVNVNQTYYTLDDQLLKDGNDLSGEYNFNTIVSPRLGIIYRPTDNINVYTVVSHGFSPPTLEETLTPNGAINTDIQPEQGWNFEIGSRGSNIGGRLSYEITFYTMRIRDLLVARRTAIDQFIGVNAGRTVHNGIEAYVHYDILNNKILQVFAGYTLADYKFTEFIDRENDFSGNRLTGTSPHIISSGIDVNESRTGLYGNITFQFTDAIPLNDANTLYNNAYKLFNSKIGWRKTFSGKWNLDIYAGVNNIFDEKYASMLQINALAPALRYYYPGLPTNYYGGLALKWFMN
ncbi:MAG: TonB-dependent receptor family protein [Saprospiraceae bacterium]